MKKRALMALPKLTATDEMKQIAASDLPRKEKIAYGYVQEVCEYYVYLRCITQDGILKVACNGVQREHNKKLNNGLPILHKVPPNRDYGRYFCIRAEKGGTSHGGLTEKLSPFFHAKKQEVNAYGR